MAPSSGDQLGHCVISGPLGAGGMGEVYRARDSRLERDVAIKVLPEGFGYDAERLARLEREAKVLASVSHPNIATLFGMETTDPGKVFLVMEIVEGEDLAQRIERGPIPIQDAIGIGRQLYYRSENGHRVFAVDVLDTDPLRFGHETLVFEGNFTPAITWGRKWDIHPDGDRFLILKLESADTVEGIRVVTNRFTELERLVPTDN